MLKNKPEFFGIVLFCRGNKRTFRNLIGCCLFASALLSSGIISSAEDKNPAFPVQEEKAAPGIPAQIDQNKPAETKPEKFVYNAKRKRNPFIPLVTSDGRILKLDLDENAKNLTVNGIIFDEKNTSYAIVNDQIIKKGDIIGEYQVFKIEINKVIFIKGEESIEVTIEKEEP